MGNTSVTITGIGTCTDTNLRIPSMIEGLPVIEIASNAFSDNKLLVSVKIPEGVMRIGASAFSGCSNLTTVSIPSSVTNIDHDAFFTITPADIP